MLSVVLFLISFKASIDDLSLAWAQCRQHQTSVVFGPDGASYFAGRNMNCSQPTGSR
jgi:hypothetical protein